MIALRHSRRRPSSPSRRARGIAMVVGPRLVVSVRERLPCRYPTRTGPLRCDRAAPSAAINSSSMMPSMVVRIRSRINSSSAPFPCHPLLLSLSMASSSGTRLPAGASCGSTRRILTPFHFFTNFATLPQRDRPHVSPHFFYVSQALRLGPAFPSILPANRVFSISRPNRVLLFVIHDDFVLCIVFVV